MCCKDAWMLECARVRDRGAERRKVIATEWRADICSHLTGEALVGFSRGPDPHGPIKNQAQTSFLSQSSNQAEGQQLLVSQLTNHSFFYFQVKKVCSFR